MFLMRGRRACKPRIETNLENGGSVPHHVVKEAVDSRAARLLAAQQGAIRQNQALEQLNVVLARLVTHIYGPSGHLCSMH